MGVPFHRVSVRLDEPALRDVGAHTDRALASCGVVLEPGSEVAIALGSRGIVDLQLVVRRVIDWVRSQGAQPFVVSAMGSHGGATAEGQREVLASYGLDEQHLGCPVRTSMDVVELPAEVGGTKVVTDAEASKASATIVVNRVKPHTDFHGPYESGLMKMIAIGLGNRVQAERIHAYGSAGLRTLVPEIGAQVLAHGNVVLGVAIVENALEQVMAVEVVPAAQIPVVEPDLLALARAHMPRLPIDDLDVLLVDQMGKDISGVGMDTNVIGRTMILGEAGSRDAAHPDDRVPPPHARLARQRVRHGARGCRSARVRRRDRSRGHPHEHRHVGLLAPRQAAARRRRRSSRVGALPAGSWRRRRRCGAGGPHRRHAALLRALGH